MRLGFSEDIGHYSHHQLSMESIYPDPSSSNKRKRPGSPMGDSGRSPAPPQIPAHINYMVPTKKSPLRLIEGDFDYTFSGAVELVDDYEGVLSRHESLAASMGADLTGPLILKGFERLFSGGIKIIRNNRDAAPITWYDIVTYAQTNPGEFAHGLYQHGSRSSRMFINGTEVEISEDDHRLIMSGGPERMLQSQPIAEDESAEIATLNILDTQLAMLIKQADVVASKARQLKYHLNTRKKSLMDKSVFEMGDPTNQFSQPGRTTQQVKESNDLQSQFLSRYMRISREHRGPSQHRPESSRQSTGPSALKTEDRSSRRKSQPISPSDDGVNADRLSLILSRVENLKRGDVIDPPCDRCRRLKFDCTKHLSACGPCTKKHCKCSWKDVKEEELMRGEPVTIQANTTTMPNSQFATPLYVSQYPQQGDDRFAHEHSMLAQMATAAEAAGDD